MKFTKNVDIKNILSRYPKERPSLSVEQRELYKHEYLMNREGKDFMSSLSQKIESWMHVKVNNYLDGNKFLELGAGSLNHFKYFDRSNVQQYDVVEPFNFLYESSKYKNSVNNYYNDISSCNEKYDRIFSIATLEHIENLPKALSKSCEILNDDGVMINAIPCEGGALWGLAWRISTGLSYKLRTGLSYKKIMLHEHLNEYEEIVSLINYFFDEVEVIFFPIYGKHFSLYACIVSKKPNIENLTKYNYINK